MAGEDKDDFSGVVALWRAAAYQCSIHGPGLSVTNRITVSFPLETAVTSRCTGFSKLKALPSL
jgi:hypothetical protein